MALKHLKNILFGINLPVSKDSFVVIIDEQQQQQKKQTPHTINWNKVHSNEKQNSN